MLVGVGVGDHLIDRNSAWTGNGQTSPAPHETVGAGTGVGPEIVPCGCGSDGVEATAVVAPVRQKTKAAIATRPNLKSRLIREACAPHGKLSMASCLR